MRELDINQQINDMLQELDQDNQLDIEIQEKSKDIATRLKISGQVVTSVKGKTYTLSYKQSDTSGQLIAIDHTRLSIAGFHYKPATFDLEFDKNFSEFENLEKLVQTFYYYKYDKIQAEDLEEEEDSLWQIKKN